VDDAAVEVVPEPLPTAVVPPALQPVNSKSPASTPARARRCGRMQVLL
jgi:hypothetical protein